MVRRVFLSHTSEFAKYPEKKSFVDAAVSAVIRAGCVPCDMEYFTARDEKSAQYCINQVRGCDVYVGIIGLRYGSPVRDRSEVSYTELEFEAASLAPAKTRLIFLLDPDALVPASQFTDDEYGKRQKEFRKRLSDAGIMCRPFTDFHELDKLIYQALKEEVPVATGASQEQERIEWPERKSPYPGLLWFKEEYAPLFFGRDREVTELIGKLSEPGGRVLLVIGASGSGKSSLVAAGIWQALIKEGRLPGSANWVWHRIQPSDGETTPFDALALGLKQALQLSARPQFTATGTTLKDLLSQHLSEGQEFILFVDQLEELFTRGFKEPDIQAFLEQLIGIAKDKANRLRVVAAMRSEYIGKLEGFTSTITILNSEYTYHVGPVSPRALQDMIEKPAQVTGYEFESDLVERMLQDAGQEPGNLPLVAYALKQLFEKRNDRTFTREAYDAMGGEVVVANGETLQPNGVVGAIGTKANDVLSRLSKAVQGAFDAVFAELVYLERERPPTRRRARLSEFSSDQAAVQLIDALAGQDCRVLVTSESGKETMVEVAHEKLFTAWPKLKGWIEKSGEALRLIEHAEEEARRWRDRGDNPQELWLGSRAQEVLAALQRFGKTSSSVLDRFLKPQHLLIEQLHQPTMSHERRALIGRILNEFGDPRAGVGLRLDGLPDIAWIKISGGQVKLDEIEVKPFRIAKYPVTSAQFEAFLKAEDGYRNEEWWKDIEQSKEAERPSWLEANGPRENVSWYEAVAFCHWLSAKTGTSIRLPTEWEWQQAATGGDPQREYPWPGGWDASRCNSYESRLNRTTAVGMYPQGVTEQGVLDMAGNVWEWCLNTYENPEQQESVRIDKSGGVRVLRGGSWNYLPVSLRASARGGNCADARATILVSVSSRTLSPNPLPFVLLPFALQYSPCFSAPKGFMARSQAT